MGGRRPIGSGMWGAGRLRQAGIIARPAMGATIRQCVSDDALAPNSGPSRLALCGPVVAGPARV